MVTWSSLNANPPSLLYPPDGQKWQVRSGIAGATAVTAPNGKSVTIVEFRGWLVSVDGICNGVDPDWHYDLELDPSWLDSLGVSLESLLLPGDAINEEAMSQAQTEILSRTSARGKYGEPIVHIELDAWRRVGDERGDPPLPNTWTFTNDCNSGQAVWPFDPLNPKAGNPPLAPGQYVRVVGSLVTDAPHMSQDWIATNSVLRFGYAATVTSLGKERADLGQANAIKQMWGGLNEFDGSHPARWNEVHSPDYIEVLPPKDRTETVRCVALVAQNGLFSGDTEALTAQIRPPGRPTRWHVLSSRKRIGPATVSSTVQIDQTTPFNDRLQIHVQVQGQSGLGSAGKFHAVYRVGWRGIAPALHGAASLNGATILGAVDADGKIMARPGAGNPPFWPSAWFELQNGRAQPGGHVTAVSRAPVCFDAFVVGTDSHVYTAATQGAGWGGWWQIAGVTVPQGGRVEAVSRSLNKLDIFCADAAGHIMSAAWEPGFTQWHGWWWIRSGVTAPGGAVTAVSRRADYLDIFVVGTDGMVYTAAWDPGPLGWQGWWRVGNDSAPIGAPVTCVSRSLDKLDLFLADGQGRIMTSSWQPGAAQWQIWAQVQGGRTLPGATVAAACRRPDFLDIFVVGTDGQVYTAAWNPGSSGWRGWWALPGLQVQPGSPIAALSPANDVLLVVTSSSAGYLAANAWQPATGWQGWSTIS